MSEFILFLLRRICMYYSFFFFNDTATTEIYTLSLHDALPISWLQQRLQIRGIKWTSGIARQADVLARARVLPNRSEEHTSELQSQSNLVCRLLLEKKKRSAVLPVSDAYGTQRLAGELWCCSVV